MSLAVGSHLTRRFTRRRCAPQVIADPLGSLETGAAWSAEHRDAAVAPGPWSGRDRTAVFENYSDPDVSRWFFAQPYPRIEQADSAECPAACGRGGQQPRHLRPPLSHTVSRAGEMVSSDDCVRF